MNAIIAKLRELQTAQILEIVDMSAARADDDGDIVLDAALTVLELRMPEADFISLCDRLAA